MFSNIASISASIVLGLQLTAGAPAFQDKVQKPQWAKVVLHAPKLQDATISVSSPQIYILSVAEQQAFKRALLRSVQLIS
jgi:hypothetical protein